MRVILEFSIVEVLMLLLLMHRTHFRSILFSFYVFSYGFVIFLLLMLCSFNISKS